MNAAQLARFKVLAAALDKGRSFPSEEAIAQIMKVNRGCAHNAIVAARKEGCVTNTYRDISTLALTPYGREVAGLTFPAETAQRSPLAETLAEMTLPPAPSDRWTGAEMRALLDVPRAAVTLVRRALATPWGPALLDAIASLADEPAPVRVAVQRARRAKDDPADDIEVEVDDDPPPRARPGRPKKGTRGEGPYRVLDADEETLGEFRTRAEAMDWLESDDQADTVVDGNGKVIGRKTGETENDDEEG